MGFRRHIVFTPRWPSRPAASPLPPPTSEVLYLNSSAGGAVSQLVLAAGIFYLVEVQGTWSAWNVPLDNGTPEPDAMFPGPVAQARNSTEVGLDAETLFASPAAHPHAPGHNTAFALNLGSGFAHLEPSGGPYSTPQPGHLYRYHVTGEGAQLSLRLSDSPLTDNYGQLKVTITSG